MIEVVHYALPNGKVPVEEYLDSLDRGLRAKTLRSVSLLREFGPLLREPESKYLRDGIFELRTVFGGNTGRVFYFFFHNGRAVLTHGFVKKSNKAPQREIEKALRYREDYLVRYG